MAQLTSQNGWPVVEQGHSQWYDAAGFHYAAANSDVAYLMARLITRYNAEVEKIAGKVLDDWSHANRPIRDQTTGYSNHASDTALDINALQHPRGVHGTFNSAKVAALRRILAELVTPSGKQVFRWGGDYTISPIDTMHFEINVTPAEVRQAAALLRLKLNPPKPTPTQSPIWKEAPMYVIYTEKGQYNYSGGSAPTPIPNPDIMARFHSNDPKVVTTPPAIIHLTEAQKNSLTQYHLANDRTLVNAVVTALTPVLQREGINPTELAQALANLEIPDPTPAP